MAFLYVNSKGTAWRKHSYSAGNDYDSSPLKYYLRRVIGWKERDTKAAFKFGRALEEAVQFFHENERDAVEDFIPRWAAHKDDKELVFTKTERDWETMDRMGREMLRLYMIRQPSLPIPLGSRSVFQREFSKEVFPGDPNYGEIEDAGKLDIIAFNDVDHPMLPKMEWKIENGIFRPLIVDIKTSALDFPENAGMAAFDKQLRRYSWLSGIRDVSLLWFKKAGHSLSKGSSATLLVSMGKPGFLAGDEVAVAQVTDEGVWIVRNDYFLEEMDNAQGRKEGRLDTTKAAGLRKAEWLAGNALRVPEIALTRQRVQFNAGYVTRESADEAGQIAARQIVQIVNSWKGKSWPNTFGIRFPSDDRRDPYFRAFVLKENGYREQNFTKSDDDDIFAEDPEAE